jgi:hypothetical protein
VRGERSTRHARSVGRRNSALLRIYVPRTYVLTGPRALAAVAERLCKAVKRAIVSLHGAVLRAIAHCPCEACIVTLPDDSVGAFGWFARPAFGTPEVGRPPSTVAVDS